MNLELSKEELSFLSVLFGPQSGMQLPVQAIPVFISLSGKIEAIRIGEKLKEQV